MRINFEAIKIWLFCILCLSVFSAPFVEAASFNDAANGNWNDGATWGNVSPGVAGTDYPGAGDTVTINSNTVTLAADAACGDITVALGGTLSAGTYTIIVSGNWDSSAGTFTYGTSTLKMTGSNKTFKGVPWNLSIGDGANPASVSYSVATWYNVVDNDLAVANNATLTITGGYYIYLPATGDITVNTGATLNVNNPGALTRYITDSSSHINSTLPDPSVGIITGTGTFEYFVGTGNTNAPVTARTYGCNLAVAGSLNAKGILGGGTSLNLGAKTLYLYDVDTNNDFYGILDNTGNIPVTAYALQVGGGPYYVTGKLISRGAVYTFTNVNVYSSQGFASPTIDCLTGGESSTWNVSGNVTIDGVKTNKGLITAGSSTWNVGGNWTNSGTFTAGTSTVDFNKSSGTQTLTSGGIGSGRKFYNLNHSGAGTLSIATNNVEVDNNGSIANAAGTIAEASGYIVHPASSLLLTDSSGSEVSEYIIRTDKIYVRLVDEDENIDGASADTTTVTVSGATNGDGEQITLTETGNTTEIFMNSGGLTTASFDGSKTNNDGTLELSSGETITVSYTDSEDGSDTKTDTATSRNPAANFLVSISSPQVAGSTFDMTITARNADNSTATGYSGTVNLALTYVTPSSGTKTLSTASISSFTNGVAAISQRYDDAGIISITATDSGDSSMYGTSSNITFVPDSFTVSVSKTTLSVNEPFTLTVTAKNSAGSTCANYQGSATLSINYVIPSTDQSGSLSKALFSSSDWSSGVAALTSFTYNKFGVITITVKDPTNTSKAETSSQLTFLPKELLVQLDLPSGGRDFYYKGEDIATTVTAKDYNGNAVANYANTISFTGKNLILPANYSFSSSDSGAHTFLGLSGSMKGKTSVTATDSVYSAVSGKSSKFTIKEGVIRVIDTQGPVGTLPVNIKLIDSDGKNITNDSSISFMVKLSEAIPNKSATSSAQVSAVTFDSGAAQIDVTDDQVEIVTVTPVSKYYLDVVPGKVAFGGVGAPRLGAGARVLWWRELRQDEERK
ncbi:MAG: hypothetical protein Q8L26_03535 [Candidatus Omnitrophota bacterium]|nr:hypothetical protein [Candidatus Omnitrophota bacterium]